MRALDEAEKRLGCVLPKAFRLNYATRPVLTKVPRWQIREPADFERTRRHELTTSNDGLRDVPERALCDSQGVPNVNGVIIGDDAGGAALMLHFRADGSTLDETLWAWEPGVDDAERIAVHLGELIEDAEPGQDEVAPDFVCAFCGSAQLKRASCSVCGRGTDETPERADQDRHRARAARLIAKLIEEEGLELVAASSAARVVERASNILAGAEERSIAELCRRLLEDWESSDAVAEIFVDEAGLSAALHAIDK